MPESLGKFDLHILTSSQFKKKEKEIWIHVWDQWAFWNQDNDGHYANALAISRKL